MIVLIIIIIVLAVPSYKAKVVALFTPTTIELSRNGLRRYADPTLPNGGYPEGHPPYPMPADNIVDGMMGSGGCDSPSACQTNYPEYWAAIQATTRH